jgi:hypothetical protein
MSSEVLFRASKVGALTTNPKSVKDKEANNLSEGAKTFVEEVWLQKEYGYRDVVVTDQMIKGNEGEQDAMDLILKVRKDGIFREKYKGEQLYNSYVTGNPDIVIPKIRSVEDTKCSYNVKTFMSAEMTNIYEWQLRSYMWLLRDNGIDIDTARVIYCLVQTPERIIEEEKKRFYFKFGCDESNQDYIDICNQIDKNHDISHIPLEKRLKSFEIKHDEDKIKLLEAKIWKAREYYGTLSL